MRHCSVFLACVILALQTIASSTCDGLPFPPSAADVTTFLSQSFHYVIIGISKCFRSTPFKRWNQVVELQASHWERGTL